MMMMMMDDDDHYSHANDPSPLQDEDAEERQYTKQMVLDALISDARLMNDTVPMSFFEQGLRKLSLKGASRVSSVETCCC
jgi:hypothetical protein